jgi:hypothetical protein
MQRDKARRWRVTTRYTGASAVSKGEPWPFVPWRRDYGLPRSWRATLEAEHLPYIVELDFTAEENDGPSCRAIRLASREGGEPISARRVRDVPIAECIQIAVGHAGIPIERTADEIRFKMGPRSAEHLTESLAHARPRSANTSDEHLREVARIYLGATGKPTRAVEEEFGPISHSTAARWVGEARRRGFLPPATNSRKGKP